MHDIVKRSQETAGRRAPPPARRLAMAVAALLALAFHSFVVQVHVHAPDRAVAAAAGVAQAMPAHRPAHRPAPLDCPGCRLFAESALPETPAPVAIAAAIVRFAVFFDPPRRSIGQAPRSHAWRGRGPPRHRPPIEA